MADTPLVEELSTSGELLSENWENQKSLHPSVTDPQMDALFFKAMENGAIGGRACGAGGGHRVLFCLMLTITLLIISKLFFSLSASQHQ